MAATAQLPPRMRALLAHSRQKRLGDCTAKEHFSALPLVLPLGITAELQAVSKSWTGRWASVERAGSCSWDGARSDQRAPSVAPSLTRSNTEGTRPQISSPAQEGGGALKWSQALVEVEYSCSSWCLTYPEAPGSSPQLNPVHRLTFVKGIKPVSLFVGKGAGTITARLKMAFPSTRKIQIKNIRVHQHFLQEHRIALKKSNPEIP